MRIMSSLAILILLFIATFGHASKSLADGDGIYKIAEILKNADVEFEILEGIGFRIGVNGSHRLNQMAKRVASLYRTYLVLDARENPSSGGSFYALDNYVRVRINESEIDSFIKWEPSIMRSNLLHEISHAYLRRGFDETGAITPLSMLLMGKRSNSLSAHYNLYYFFLNLQEFVTYAKQLRLLLGNKELLEEKKSELDFRARVFVRFGIDVFDALEFVVDNLESAQLKFSEIMDDELRLQALAKDRLKFDELNKNSKRIPIRFLRIESAEWDLFLPMDPSQSVQQIEQNRKIILRRLTDTRDIASQSVGLAKRIRSEIAKDNTDVRLLTKIISELLQLTVSSYRPRSALHCSSLL